MNKQLGIISVILLTSLLTSLLLGCTQKSALILDKSKHFYGRDNRFNQNKYGSASLLKTREITVKGGDTLTSVAKAYRIPLRDLIIANHLSPPYNLSTGDKLSIPATLYHVIKEGDTIYSVSRKYGMSIDQLIEINNLNPPYELKAGQQLRVTKYLGSETSDEESESAQNVRTKKSASDDFKIVEADLEEKSNRFAWPLRGEIISKFGPKKAGLYNDGINIKAEEGQEVKAAEDGLVAYVGNELRGYGNLIIIKHNSGFITAYAHLSKPLVSRGQKIEKSQVIGLAGSTGHVSSTQLYFGLRKGRNAINPENYLESDQNPSN